MQIMGKDLTITSDVMAAAVTYVANGGFLTRAARFLEVDYFNLRRALMRDPELWAQLRAAREAGADALVSQAIDIVDNPVGDPHRQRNQAQVRQWAAGKLAPKEYGDQLQVNVQGTIDLSAAMAEGKQRLARPVCDQQNAIDVESVEVSKANVSSLPDSQSVVAEIPDIFS